MTFQETLIVVAIIAVIVAVTLISIAWIISKIVDKVCKVPDGISEKQKLEWDEIKLKTGKLQIEFSHAFIDYVQYLCAQISTIEFRKFKDGHDLEKATRIQIAEVAESAARQVKDVMQFEKIDFDHTNFTQRYLESLIVDTIVIDIKNLLNNALLNPEE